MTDTAPPGTTIEATPLVEVVSPEELGITLRDDVQIPVDTEDEAETLVPTLPDSAPVQAAEQDLWQRIRAGFRLEHHLDNPRVQAELNWYARHPDYLDRVATRAARHLYHIVEAIEQRDLPMEIALLPIVESAFDPFAYSHGRASGLWQFIPATGRRYGLKIDYWYDGRRDVPAATRAALDYLETLHAMLREDWMLALAAYNSGEGNVQYSIRRNLAAGKDIDFFSLKLLRETSTYVPKLLAISALVADPSAYGITLKSIKNVPYWEMVDIGAQLDLAKAAELAEIDMEELYLLNPALNSWSTHPEGPHYLLLPVEKAPAFGTALAALPAAERVRWVRHKIRSGESLGTIAARYNTSVSALRSANKLRGNLIRAGDSLVIPMATEPGERYELSEEERLKSLQASVEERLGQTPVKHLVQPGDNLWEIAQMHDVPVRTLARWNGMAPTDVLQPGRELAIFTTAAKAQPEAVLAPMDNEVIRKINYSVRRGESLSLIAQKFNVAVSDIRKWNKAITGRKYLQPGDRLMLYIDVTRAD
ncbi:MAG: LysM peptidoglycan-binding domain-containing protein [Pseudomonadota bacterium]